MRHALPRGLGLLACLIALQSPARADDEGSMQLVVSERSPSRTIVFVLDPRAMRLLVYECGPSPRELTLSAVRDLEEDVAPATSARHTQPEPSAANLVERELELGRLRRILAAAQAQGESPSFKGRPLAEGIRDLERQSALLRLELAVAQGLDALRAALHNELEAREAALSRQVATCQAVIASLPPNHAARPVLELRLQEQHERLQAVQAVREAEGD